MEGLSLLLSKALPSWNEDHILCEPSNGILNGSEKVTAQEIKHDDNIKWSSVIEFYTKRKKIDKR